MNLLNTTKLVAGYTMAIDKTGREWLVVVVKGTYGFPDEIDGEPSLLDEQMPLVMTDEFTGEPAVSAPSYENDFAPAKPRCDVLVNGSCHAPAGRPATRVDVGLRVGHVAKSFRVVGSRAYEKRIGSCAPSDPVPFTVMPITYDRAYGGIDRTQEDPTKHRWYPLNHAGVGYYPSAGNAELNGLLLPNTEELNNPVTRADGSFAPMALGPLARAWRQRLRWAGTYDQTWLDHQFPFLPEDFDAHYFQSAPEDQQIDHPRGGEEVVLKNLTPQGRTSFRLPRNLDLPVLFLSRDGRVTEVSATVDTVFLEPDRRRFMLSWRAAIPLRRNIQEVREVIIDQNAHDLEVERARLQRMQGKRVGSLAENVEWFRSSRARSRRDDTH